MKKHEGQKQDDHERHAHEHLAHAPPDQAHPGHAHLAEEPAGLTEAETDDHSDVVATVATVAVVGLGVAVFEAALLPGVVLGVAAMWAPQYFPKMGAALQPLFRSTVRGAYKLGQKTKEFVAEAQEQVHDIVAEVHSEDDIAASKAASNQPSA